MKAVLSEPDNDIPRIELANWFIENEDTSLKPCPNCSVYWDEPDHPRFWKGAHPIDERGMVPQADPASGRHEGGWTNCKTCNCPSSEVYAGKPGFVLESNRFADRGEFIKVQLQLHGDQWHHDKKLEERSRELLHKRWPGSAMHNEALWLKEHTEAMLSPARHGWKWEWRRGFLDTIEVGIADWIVDWQTFYWHPSAKLDWCQQCGGVDGLVKNCDFCAGSGFSDILTDIRAETVMPLRTVTLTRRDGSSPPYPDVIKSGPHTFERTLRYSSAYRSAIWKCAWWPDLNFIFDS